MAPIWHACSLKPTIENIVFYLRNEVEFPTPDCGRGFNGLSLSGMNLKFKSLCALPQLIVMLLIVFHSLGNALARIHPAVNSLL